MKTNIITLKVFTLCFLFISSLQGQEENESLLSDTVIVVKDLQLNVEERAPYLLRHEGQSQTQKVQTYQQVSDLEEIDITYQDPPLSIKPIRYTDRLEKKGNDGLIKIGYGTPRAIDSKILYTYHIEDWYQLGVKAGYSSANNEEVDQMKYTDWHVGIMGGYCLTPQFKISLDSDFKRNNQGLYGLSFGEKPILDERATQSITNRIGINLSKYESIGLQLDATLGYDAAQMIDFIDQQNHLFGSVHLAKNLWNDFSIDVTADLQTLSVWDADNLNSFGLNPALRYLQENLAIEAGIHYLQYEDSAILWPRIKVDYGFTEQPITVQLFSSLTSQVTSLQHLTNINLFITSESGTVPAGLTRNRQIGVNGTYSKTQFSIKPYYLFNLQDDVINFRREEITFGMRLLDDLQTHTVGLECNYTPNGILNIGLDGYYNFYNGKHHVSYLPLYKVELTANQKFISDRLLLTQAIHLSERTVGGSPINPLTGQGFDSQILNLNASINFKIFPHFWIYAEGDNLFFQDYEIWQAYEVFQPKAIFGIKYLVGQK